MKAITRQMAKQAKDKEEEEDKEDKEEEQGSPSSEEGGRRDLASDHNTQHETNKGWQGEIQQ